MRSVAFRLGFTLRNGRGARLLNREGGHTNVIRFELVDITNLLTPDSPHVHGFTMHLVDANHIELEFAFRGNGKESVEHIELTRVAIK